MGTPKADTSEPGDRKWSEDETGLRVVDNWYLAPNDDSGYQRWEKRYDYYPQPSDRILRDHSISLKWQVEALNCIIEGVVKQGYQVALELERRFTLTTSDDPDMPRKVVRFEVVRFDIYKG